MNCVVNISKVNFWKMSIRSCDLCFEVTDNMRCHIKESHEDSRDDFGFFCHECDVSCPSLTDVIRHKCASELNAMGNGRKRNNLKKIVKKGLKQIVQKSMKSVLTKQFRRHRSQMISRKSCDICFVKTHDLNDHMKVDHESPKELVCFSCPDCGKNFSRLMESMKHKCSNPVESESCFEETLGFSSSDERLLLEKPQIKVDSGEIHMSGDLLDEFVENKEFNVPKCNVCKKGFEGKADLAKHRSLKHQFPCQICFNKFPLMLATHHDAKSFQDGWLQGHMRTTHTL